MFRNEGADSWRPVQALREGLDDRIIAQRDESDEKLQFDAGILVICESKAVQDGVQWFNRISRNFRRPNLIKLSMNNPIRRNRNIGTRKQGHGSNNALNIPQPSDTLLEFYERITNYRKEEICVHGRTITAILEQLKKGYFYSCSVQDIKRILDAIPETDLRELEIILFRQPKKKEDILEPAWGRLIYSFQFDGIFSPAIVIEAVKLQEKHKYPRKQTVEENLEFELLKKDGLLFTEGKRHFVADVNEHLFRNIQLYRTLLHEIGHYVHYLDKVERIGNEDEDYEEWERRHNAYMSIPQREKEEFANKYAMNWKQRLTELGIIPYDRIE